MALQKISDTKVSSKQNIEMCNVRPPGWFYLSESRQLIGLHYNGADWGVETINLDFACERHDASVS